MTDYFFSFGKMDYVRGKKAEGCILCKIRDASPDVADLSVFRGAGFIATVNLYPYNPGHLIVFPERHVGDLRELGEDEALNLHRITGYLLDILDKTHEPFAYNLGYNMGREAGASIQHLHNHIIPRYPREIGISDLIAGKRVLVEDPLVTRDRIAETIRLCPFRSPGSA